MKRQAIYTAVDTGDLIEAGREWNFHEADTQEHLHTLHPYPAKFIPQIPRKAIVTWSRKGDVVYDPFCGCGTTLLEASLLDRPSIGTDNNAVAVLVSRAKVATYNPGDLRTLCKFSEHLERALPNAAPRPDLIPTDKKLNYWFSRKVLERLSALKGLILDTREPLRTILLASFSAIIVRVSYQDSDTRYARIERAVDPKAVDKAFKGKLMEVLKSLQEIAIARRSPGMVYQADARSVPFIPPESVGLIVTSPPYLNAYDYHKYHRQRIHWINGNVEFARDLEIGSHDEFTKPKATPDQYFFDMDACFGEWARVLRRGGRCVVLIGDAIVTKRPVRVADKYIKIGFEHGLELEQRWIRELKATKRSFNVWNSRMSHEHVLLFRKPKAAGKSRLVTALPP
jgi:DNA modification methylase